MNKESEAQRDQSAYPDSHSWAHTEDSDPGAWLSCCSQGNEQSVHWAWVFAARKEEPGQLELRQVLSAHPPPRAVSEKELAQPDTWAQNGSVWGAE